MVIRLCHAAHNLPLSSHEAWDSRGSMCMGTIQTSHNPPHTALIHCVRRPPRATNLRVLLHDMGIGTGQVQHMPGQPYHGVYQPCL